MLETAARKLLVETEQAAKLRGCCGDLWIVEISSGAVIVFSHKSWVCKWLLNGDSNRLRRLFSVFQWYVICSPQSYKWSLSLFTNPKLRLQSHSQNLTKYLFYQYILWSSGHSSWLQIQRFRVRFPALSDVLRSSGSGTGSTEPREYNWGATWMEK
jgi:hypothetical protein